MSNMNAEQLSRTEWERCAPGEITHMVQRIKARRFLSMVRRDATVLTMMMAALFSGYYYFGIRPDAQIDIGDIYCYQVQPLAEQLLTGQLDPDTRSRIQRHLRSCEFCRRHVEQVRAEALHHGREGERDNKWESVRNPEMVAQRGETTVLPVGVIPLID